MATAKKAAKKKAPAAKSADKKLVVGEHKLFESHAGHANHLCELVSKRQMAKVARAAKDAKYICHICGRAASKASSLCEPVEI
jgi:DNA-binding MurR/RpiR family transcriptional regulator